MQEYDVVVAGGGMAGLCTALAAARAGVKTVLIHNRPVLGGNASSEVRVHICGATVHGKRKNARETGILEELLLENKRRNPQYSYSVWDTILWEKAYFQENLTLYLNTQIFKVMTEGDRITRIRALQMTTEKELEFAGKIFVDCTGDGLLAVQAGADTRMGREARSEYGESFAPEQADHCTMGNTLMFCANDTGAPCSFEKPEWAYDITEEQLAGRAHTAAGDEPAGVDSGYWWLELGGTQNVIADSEEIRDELLKTLYGIWDHIKNKPGHGAENYALDWIQFLPGKREGRRILGEHVLCQQEVADAVVFEDAVAYGGWPMDMHPPEGFRNEAYATEYLHLDKVYGIPYRCYYSRNIKNLMMAGRTISATHTAFGSVRVMGTCAVGGQAVGTAAAMAVKADCLPGQIGNSVKALQQRLLRDDCYIPGIRNEDGNDKARTARVCASSWQTGWEPDNVINGIARPEEGNANGWRSKSFAEGEPWIKLDFEETDVASVELKFDSDLAAELMITMSKVRQKMQPQGLPGSLVKSYTLLAYRQGRQVYRHKTENNGQRFVRHRFPEGIRADAIVLQVHSCYGEDAATVFEIRIYA